MGQLCTVTGQVVPPTPLAKATQAREVIAFCDHGNTVSGHDPHLLIMDQKVTTRLVLAELNDRGVKFLTLRMHSTRTGPPDRRPHRHRLHHHHPETETSS